MVESSSAAPLTGLVAAVDRVLSEQVSAPVQADELAELVRQADRLGAAIADRVQRFEAQQGHQAHGHSTAASWLRHHLLMGARDASSWVRTARAMSSLPLAREAWEAGEVPTAHAHHLGSAARANPRAIAEVEDILVEQATKVDAEAFGRLVRRTLELADPEAGSRRARQAYEERRCFVATVGEQEVLRGAWDMGDGGWVRRALEVFAEVEFRADAALEPADRRNPQARNADAFVEICRTALAHKGHTGRVAPRVSVIIDADTLAGDRPADLRQALIGWLAPTEGQAPARRCERDDGAPLPLPVAQRLACDAGFQRVLRAGSRVLDLGRQARLATEGQRHALVVRDGGCRFPGCHRPHWWCQAHHLQPFDRGGGTDLANLALLCSHHHHLVHEGGYTTRGDPQAGTLCFFTPAGTPVSHRPARAGPADRAA